MDHHIPRCIRDLPCQDFLRSIGLDKMFTVDEFKKVTGFRLTKQIKTMNVHENKTNVAIDVLIHERFGVLAPSFVLTDEGEWRQVDPNPDKHTPDGDADEESEK